MINITEKNIEETYKATFFEKNDITLYTIKTQKHINKEAIKLLVIISSKQIPSNDSAVNISKDLTQNNNMMKHIDNVQNDFVDSIYFFMIMINVSSIQNNSLK